MNCIPEDGGFPFHYQSGSLYCENVEIDTIVSREAIKKSYNVSNRRVAYDEPSTPVYIYSLSRIRKNVASYIEALRSCSLSGKIGYAIKANPNLGLVSKLKEFGVEIIIAVSGYEVLAAMKAGFAPGSIILNGNGKQEWEIKLALEVGAILNVDSTFDAKRIVQLHRQFCSNNVKDVSVFLRIRPHQPSEQQLNLTVHEYVNTAEKSKFGFQSSELTEVLEILLSNDKIKIIGVHCHFGSGISNPKVYEWLGSTVTEIRNELNERGVSIKTVNVGGGIGINYYEKPHGFCEHVATHRDQHNQEIPEISTFLTALSSKIPTDVDVIVEPGRSLVGNAGILVCKVLGTKASNLRKIMVVDGSMNEVIRPCLYGAHHEICPVNLHPTDPWDECDIVGPICESSDFLGKKVLMQMKAKYVAVMSVGAYCSSMASTYNLKPHAAEILVNGTKWTYIRNRDSFEDIVDKWYST